MSLHKLILTHLQDASLSLANLQVKTQVSLPTLRKAIHELTEGGWIRVTGQSESSGGRPAMLFGLDDSNHIIVSIHIQLPGIRLIASDLCGAILHETFVFSTSIPRPYEAIREIEVYFSTIKNLFSERVILGIGIATPGYIDPNTGNIVSIERVTGWQDLPISDHLRTYSSLPVYIANDIDCMAFAEFQYSQTSLEKNLMYVGFDEGVKVCMFLNGQLYKGAFGNVGLIMGDYDLSQQKVKTSESLTIQGINKLFLRQVDKLQDVEKAKYTDILSMTDTRQRLEVILEQSVAGDPICQRCVESLVQAFIKSIVTTTYLIQPDIIVIGGILSNAPKEIYKQIQSSVYRALPVLFANHLIIRQAELSHPNRATIGASHHFLQTYLSDPITDLLTTIVY